MVKSTAIRRGLLGALACALVPVPAGAAELPSHRQLERAGDRFLADQPPTTHQRRGSGGVATRARRLLPGNRVISLYGAPQMGRTVVGLTPPERLGQAIAARSGPYEALGDRPVVGSVDLVAVFATAGGGPDGLYRSRQDDQIIQIYLEHARAAGARLMLDIQPGRARIRAEMRALRRWLVQPDVDLAIDAEWNVGRRGVPSRTEGKVTARQLNRASKTLARLVRRKNLPPKLLLVHQFKRNSIRGERKVRKRGRVQTILNFDGIGSQAAKASGYQSLAVPRLFNGFTIFEQLDDKPVMRPPAIVGLQPSPDFVLYQ